MIDFQQHPDISLPIKGMGHDPASYGPQYKAVYHADYPRLFGDIARGELPAVPVYRQLIKTDLFFIVFFIMGILKANHPFVVKACQLVQHGPKSKSLDVWAREHYKAIDVTEPVWTADGYKAHGDLNIGDTVYSPSGEPTKVIGKTEVFTSAPCMQVTFSDGYSIKVSEQHEWQVNRKIRRRIKGSELRKIEFEPSVLETSQLSIGDRIGVCSPLVCKEVALPIPPYTFGAWLGDGHSCGGKLTNAYCDKEILDYIIADGISVSETKSSNLNSGSYSLNAGAKGRGMTFVLRKLGVQYNKHIPLIYLTASISQRMNLLQGLMDTDGSANGRGTATFCNKSQQLSEDVYTLAASLGFKPRIRRHTLALNGERYPFYQVSFQAYQDNPPFKLSRKIAKCSTGKRSGTLDRVVSKLEYIDPVPVSCIQVESPDGLYLVGRQLVPTHNSVIITTAETIQDICENPEETHVIFSYKKPKAEDFLFSIKSILEKPFMYHCFPEIFYQNPHTESDSWSLQNGILVKRQSTAKEKTVEAYGLVEGMPTGGHWDRRVYDDVETADLAKNPDQLGGLIEMFEMSKNLGTDGGRERIIGTFYSHCGMLVHLRDKKTITGEPAYLPRIIPATHDGTIHGEPVLLSQERLDELKMDSTFNSQQLCDPVPKHDVKLPSGMFKPIEPKFIPKGCFRFMVIDQAGDDKLNKGKGDMWSCGVFDVEPFMDNLGASRIFMVDCFGGRLSHSEAIEGITKLYLRNGMILQVGVEKVSLSTTEIHIQDALRVHGRRLSLEDKNLILLKPAGRSVEQRVESALQWPLLNGMLHYSTAISESYIDQIKSEMDKYPYYHPDFINMMAYLYDLLKDFEFGLVGEEDDEEEYESHLQLVSGRSRITGY